jgi:hypothetical protein
MPRPIRQTLIATLVALHAVTTLGGAGLHTLPGWRHNSGLHPLAKNDHSHGPGKSSHEASDDCAVCQLLAQSQVSPDPTGGLVSWSTVGAVPAAAPAPVFPPLLGTPAPRGPPPPVAAVPA